MIVRHPRIIACKVMCRFIKQLIRTHFQELLHIPKHEVDREEVDREEADREEAELKVVNELRYKDVYAISEVIRKKLKEHLLVIRRSLKLYKGFRRLLGIIKRHQYKKLLISFLKLKSNIVKSSIHPTKIKTYKKDKRMLVSLERIVKLKLINSTFKKLKEHSNKVKHIEAITKIRSKKILANALTKLRLIITALKHKEAKTNMEKSFACNKIISILLINFNKHFQFFIKSTLLFS